MENKVDLTLRLGLPFHDNQRKQHVNGNWLAQNGKLEDASNQNFQASNSNVIDEYKSPYFMYENPNIHIGGIFGSNDVRRSRETPKTCKDCGNGKTPLWRKGPEGPQTLCNACGLRYARLMKRAT